jgi:hypothetical protein
MTDTYPSAWLSAARESHDGRQFSFRPVSGKHRAKLGPCPAFSRAGGVPRVNVDLAEPHQKLEMMGTHRASKVGMKGTRNSRDSKSEPPSGAPVAVRHFF